MSKRLDILDNCPDIYYTYLNVINNNNEIRNNEK